MFIVDTCSKIFNNSAGDFVVFRNCRFTAAIRSFRPTPNTFWTLHLLSICIFENPPTYSQLNLMPRCLCTWKQLACSFCLCLTVPYLFSSIGVFWVLEINHSIKGTRLTSCSLLVLSCMPGYAEKPCIESETDKLPILKTKCYFYYIVKYLRWHFAWYSVPTHPLVLWSSVLNICPIKSVLFKGEKTIKCILEYVIQLLNIISCFDGNNQGLESVLWFAERYPC